MKLTEKGLLKIIGDIVVSSPECPLSETLENWNRVKDFDQDDFEDTICLTIDQAKGLLEIAKDYRMYLFQHCRIPLSLSSNEAFTALREKIEQAEGREWATIKKQSEKGYE